MLIDPHSMGGAGIVYSHVGDEHTMKHWSRVAAFACGIVLHVGAAPALAAGPGGGGGGGGGAGGGGGGGTAPVLVNYKITGTIGAPGGCSGGVVQPGFQEICPAFPTGTPYTLTFTVNVSTQAGLQNDNNQWCGTSTTNPTAQINTTRTVALFSKAIENFNLQLANGVSYVGPGPSGDVSLENDTCLAGGVAAWDTYTVNAKSVNGPNLFPSFSSGTATVSYVLFLAEMASIVDPRYPLPPALLSSLNLATAAPETHLLLANNLRHAIEFRFPTAASPSWGVGLQITTFEVVP